MSSPDTYQNCDEYFYTTLAKNTTLISSHLFACLVGVYLAALRTIQAAGHAASRQSRFQWDAQPLCQVAYV